MYCPMNIPVIKECSILLCTERIWSMTGLINYFLKKVTKSHTMKNNVAPGHMIKSGQRQEEAGRLFCGSRTENSPTKSCVFSPRCELLISLTCFSWTLQSCPLKHLRIIHQIKNTRESYPATYSLIYIYLNMNSEQHQYGKWVRPVIIGRASAIR